MEKHTPGEMSAYDRLRFDGQQELLEKVVGERNHLREVNADLLAACEAVAEQRADMVMASSGLQYALRKVEAALEKARPC